MLVFDIAKRKEYTLHKENKTQRTGLGADNIVHYTISYYICLNSSVYGETHIVFSGSWLLQGISVGEIIIIEFFLNVNNQGYIYSTHTHAYTQKE